MKAVRLLNVRNEDLLPGSGNTYFLERSGRLFQTPRSSFWRPHNTLLFVPASVPARSRRWGGPVPLLACLVCNRSSSDLTAESCAACGSRPAATWVCPSRAPRICPLSPPPHSGGPKPCSLYCLHVTCLSVVRAHVQEESVFSF